MKGEKIIGILDTYNEVKKAKDTAIDLYLLSLLKPTRVWKTTNASASVDIKNVTHWLEFNQPKIEMMSMSVGDQIDMGIADAMSWMREQTMIPADRFTDAKRQECTGDLTKKLEDAPMFEILGRIDGKIAFNKSFYSPSDTIFNVRGMIFDSLDIKAKIVNAREADDLISVLKSIILCLKK